MKRNGGGRATAFALCFLAGVAVDSWLRVYGPPKPSLPNVVDTPLPPEAEPHLSPPDRPKPLRMPIDGVSVDAMKGGFNERRTGHPHEAVDLLAPRNTEVHAVQNGTIAKLFFSKAGGNTIYQFDPERRLCFYYAHLERYAGGLHDGNEVRQGDVIGYVGTSGNAPPNTPHLHFAVFEVGPDHRWWRGQALDPYLVFLSRG